MYKRQILIATYNPGKLREIKAILKGIPYQLITLEDIQFDEEIPESGRSFKENAILKARIIGQRTHLVTLAEDSGLEVDVLDGRPGIYSARYAKGTDLDRINKLLEELKAIPKEKRKARFRSVVAIYDPTKEEVKTFQGASDGYITDKPVGNNGFGYDPIFFNLDLGKTNGQATAEEKNRVSHRARALKRARNILRNITI